MATKEVSSAGVTSSVESTLQALIDSWNRHDMEVMASLFCEEADFVNVVGMRFESRNELAKAHRILHRERFALTRLKSLQQSIKYLSDDIALAHVRWEMTGDPAAKGGARRGVITHVLVRRNGEWLFRATQNTDIVYVPEFANHPFWSKYQGLE